MTSAELLKAIRELTKRELADLKSGKQKVIYGDPPYEVPPARTLLK